MVGNNVCLDVSNLEGYMIYRPRLHIKSGKLYIIWTPELLKEMRVFANKRFMKLGEVIALYRLLYMNKAKRTEEMDAEKKEVNISAATDTKKRQRTSSFNSERKVDAKRMKKTVSFAT
mmetsp:Transcript_9898/g.13779  ORF Transcript_9898/g.13779 Transcript_9898/m.13779 type:complete len:118 (-) Transcript_9898:213-566(-)